MPQDPNDPLSRSMIGRIALDRGFLSESDLAEFKRTVEESGGAFSLLEYLLERKGLPPEQVADLLRARAAEGAERTRENIEATGEASKLAERGSGAENAEATNPSPHPPAPAADDEPISIEPVPAELPEKNREIPETVGPISPTVAAGDEPVLIEPANAEHAEKSAETAETTRRTVPPRPVSPTFSVASAPPAPSAPPVSAPAPTFSAISAPPAPSATSTRLQFGFLAVRLGYATPEQLAVALDQQRFLQKRRRPARIGEILVSQSVLSARQVLNLLRLQGKTLVRCTGCGTRFNAERFDPLHPIPCRRCGQPLVQAAAEDIAQPSAQGTFVNLPAVRAADPDATRPAGANLSQVPGSSLPLPTLSRPVSSSRLTSVREPLPPPPRPLIATDETPVVIWPALPAGRSPSGGDSPNRAPQGSGTESTPPGGGQILSRGAPVSLGLPSPEGHVPGHAPAASAHPGGRYEYRDYLDSQKPEGVPRWVWIASGAGVFAAILFGWLFSWLADRGTSDAVPAGEPPPSLRTRPPRKAAGASPGRTAETARHETAAPPATTAPPDGDVRPAAPPGPAPVSAADVPPPPDANVPNSASVALPEPPPETHDPPPTADEPERLVSEVSRWVGYVFPQAIVLRRAWPGLIDLSRPADEGSPSGDAWSEWKSANPLASARSALALFEERPDAGRLLPRAAGRVSELARALDALYGAAARKAHDSVPSSFPPVEAGAAPAEEVLRNLPEAFVQAVGEDALRALRAAIAQIAESAGRRIGGSTSDLSDLRKEARTIGTRFSELARLDEWPADARSAAAVAEAYHILLELLDAVERDPSLAQSLLRDLRQRLEEASPSGTR